MSYPRKIANSCRQRLSLKRQQGVVIIVALFIVALAATMAYAMMARLERDTRRTGLLLHNTQAEFYAQGSLAWAIDQLRTNWERQKTNKLIDEIPITSPENEMNGYKIVSKIYDMQARFNLNNLNNAEAQTNFIRLLQTVEPNLTQQKAQDITRAITDWISPGTQQNEYNKYYLSLSPPYQAAHRPMISSSELRLVKGVTPALFQVLEPYIAALPGSQPINVETASPPVLMTLSPTLTFDVAKAIEQARQQAPITSTQAFYNLDIVKNHHISTGNITVASQYFLVETKVSIEKQAVVLYTLLERLANDNKVTVSILWQSKSIW